MSEMTKEEFEELYATLSDGNVYETAAVDKIPTLARSILAEHFLEMSKRDFQILLKSISPTYYFEDPESEVITKVTPYSLEKKIDGLIQQVQSLSDYRGKE